MDDEFAQLASEFDTVDEMRADLRERITRVRKMSQGADARDKVLEVLVAITEIPVPEKVLEAEIEARAHDAVHSFDHNEEALTAHIESEGKTREEFDEEIREASVEAVKTQLLLDKLAEVTEVGVSQEEFTQRILYNAQRFGLSPDEYFQRLQEANQLGSIFADVRRGKALAAAVSQATITDASGNTLDIDELFGVEDVEDESDDESGVEVDADGTVTVDADPTPADDPETDDSDEDDSDTDEKATSLDKS